MSVKAYRCSQMKGRRKANKKMCQILLPFFLHYVTLTFQMFNSLYIFHKIFPLLHAPSIVFSVSSFRATNHLPHFTSTFVRKLISINYHAEYIAIHNSFDCGPWHGDKLHPETGPQFRRSIFGV